jgi:hypothetical protein
LLSLYSQISAGTETDIQQLVQLVREKGFCRLSGDRVRSLLLRHYPPSLQDWPAFQESWSQLALDEYMADRGRYRKRRYAVLSAAAPGHTLQIQPHQPHYQSRDYNRLNGGVQRYFEPINETILSGSAMSSLLTLAHGLFDRLLPCSGWHIEVHQFRIEADGAQAALPTPEGPHRDGVIDFWKSSY